MASEDERRQKSLEEYRRRLIEHRELDAKLKKSKGTLLCVRENGRSLCSQSIVYTPPPYSLTVREELRELTKDFDKSEEDLKSLQSGVGQIVGEVLRQLTEDKCECSVASYPGLLTPVFVACSTNTGEGLVKLSHVQ